MIFWNLKNSASHGPDFLRPLFKLLVEEFKKWTNAGGVQAATHP